MANNNLKKLAGDLAAARSLKEAREEEEAQARDAANEARRNFTDAHEIFAKALVDLGLIDCTAQGWLKKADAIMKLLLDEELTEKKG